MSELDLFETRFAMAYRRHLEKAPRPPSAAAVVQAITAHPGGRSIEWPWAGQPLVLRPAQALAWIVLLGLLIAAFAAGMFFASQPVRPLPAVVPTIAPSTAVPAFVCPPGSTPNTPGPVDQARPPGSNSLAFDRQAGRIVALAGLVDGFETWTFDVCANTWTQMHPMHEPTILGAWDSVYDTDSDLTIVVDREQPMAVWVYDLHANTWTRHGDAPLDVTPVAYDPLTGLVVAANNATELWNYDVDTDTWSAIPQDGGPARVVVFAYDASVDRLIAYAAPIGREATWLLDLRTGTWRMSDVATPGVVWGMYRPSVAYDEAAERTVVGPQAYDATADRWESLTDDFEPMFQRGGPMVYDPLNRRLVGYREGDSGATADLIALDVAARQWTVLLEAQPPTTERNVP